MITLLKHQQKAVDLFKNKSQILGHEMGTGKTISAIYIHKERMVVIACPPKQIKNWFNELTVTVGETDVQVIKTGKDKVLGRKWVIVSYNMLAKFLVQFGAYTGLVGDESHYIKNRTDRTKAFLTLAKEMEVVTLLTGTPITKEPIEIWNQLVAVKATITKAMTKTKFGKAYCGARLERNYWNGKWTIKYHTPTGEKLELLKSVIADAVDIVKKKEVLDLPPKIVQEIQVELDDYERLKYKSVWNDYMDTVKSNPEISIDDIKNIRSAKGIIQLGKFRQITSIAKARYIIETIEEIGEQQAVIFCEFIETIDYINAELKKLGIKYSTLKDPNGVEKFQTKQAQIFTANIIAGGEGLNLQNASLIFMVDEHYTPAKNMQAEDRIHRKGQTETCNIYYLRVPGTVDDKIKKVNETRKDTINQII